MYLPPSRDSEIRRPNGKNVGRQARHGVLLINLGTPENLDVPSVRRYLAEFLSDPEVIRLPTGLGLLNGPLGRMIARFRAPASTEMYKRIWTDRGSPLKAITEDQVRMLESELPAGWRVFYGMRYGRPSIAQAIRDVEKAGIEELVVVPLYPQFSGPTTGTALRVLHKELERLAGRMQVTTRANWYDDAGYVHAQAALIKECLDADHLSPDDTFLLFSAHGLPESYVKRGDPYPEHIQRTIELVVERLGWPADRCSLGYQSRLGPAKWLEPSTDDVLMRLAREGEDRVLVCSISFVTDCLETLEEIDVRYREQFEAAGGELHVCPSLNTFGPFIAALKELVLRGPRPVVTWSDDDRPLMAREAVRPAEDAEIDSLVMIGASLPNRLGHGEGPEVSFSTADGLRSVKRSQCEVPALLQTIGKERGIREGWLWNTCRRFEYFAWLRPGVDGAERDGVIARTRRHLFGDHEPEGLSVNVLHGAAAWTHLLRTAVGLNSTLPGERDILDQLHAAHRLAQCPGAVGPISAKLLADVEVLERDLRERTDWGRFEPDYCYASLSRVFAPLDLDIAGCRCLVIGGSTTSASVLRTLIDRFDVPSRQLTLLYRGHKRGGQIKLLRKAIGNGKRTRVQSYCEPGVTEAIAKADVVFFGIDSDQPVVDAARIRQCRDLADRPLTIVDFNMHGSTRGLDDVDGVHVITAQQLETAVTAFADEMCGTERFANAVSDVEHRIKGIVEEGVSVTAPCGENGKNGHARSAEGMASIERGLVVPSAFVGGQA